MEALPQRWYGHRRQRAAIVPRDLPEHGHPGSLRAVRSHALQRVAENTVVLARVVRDVYSTLHRDERRRVRAGERIAENLEDRGRIRGADEGRELAVDRVQRNVHGERLQRRNPGGERSHVVTAAHGGSKRHARLEMHPGRAGAREQATAHEGLANETTGLVANLDHVLHDAPLAGHVGGLPSVAPLDDVPVVTLEESTL